MNDQDKLEVGRIVSTNYDTGPYVIKEIRRGCRCAAYYDVINNSAPPEDEIPEHVHLVCNGVDGDRGNYYLNRFHFVDGRWKCVENEDALIMGDMHVGFQRTLF